MKPIRLVSVTVSTGAEPDSAAFNVQIENAERLIREAGLGTPDIIALPELFAHAVYPMKDWKEKAEDLEGETITRFLKLAVELNCMVVCPILRRVGKKVYNAVVFISREGRVIDCYHKRIPIIGEMDEGICSGSDTVVIDTPVGRLGALVCFDLNFVEVHQALREKRPQIIFFPSMFRGGVRLRYLALECASYVVGVVPASNQLINPLGRLLNKAGSRQESFSRLPQYLEETINLNFGVYHLDYNMDVLRELRNRHAGKVRLEVAQGEAVFLLESLDPELAMEDIEREFHLERSLDYFDRARNRALQVRRDP